MITNIGKHVVVRSVDAGVIAGILVAVDGDTYIIERGRKAWYWTGAFAVEGLAVYGPGAGSKISAAADQTVHGVCQSITCTPESTSAWVSSPEHKA